MLANPHDRDLWARFDRIAVRCDVKVLRTGEGWQVTLRERHNGHLSFVSAPLSLLEAVAEIVNNAEPGGPPPPSGTTPGPAQSLERDRGSTEGPRPMPESGPDLWLRLAALDKCCTVSLTSFYTGTDPITSALRWRMTITLRDADAGSPIIVEADGATEATGDAIDRAEHLGWDNPKAC